MRSRLRKTVVRFDEGAGTLPTFFIFRRTECGGALGGDDRSDGDSGLRPEG